jgi:molecular chaperone GrpE
MLPLLAEHSASLHRCIVHDDPASRYAKGFIMSRKVTDPSNEEQLESDLAADPADSAAASPDNHAQTNAEVAQLQNEVDRFKGERDQLVDRLARLQAEFENARKREARERADFRDFAISGAVEQFLPVLDNFQLALGSSGTVEQLRTGVELIVKQMEEVLRSLNVQPVETVGSRFDPRVHEALESVERSDLPDHQVLAEVRRG